VFSVLLSQDFPENFGTADHSSLPKVGSEITAVLNDKYELLILII
jgi:hypothetical protein